MSAKALLERVWDVDAGDPALDFVNSIEWRNSSRPVDRFIEYVDVVSWGIAASILTPENGVLLMEFAEKHPQKAKQSTRRIILLRESLSRIFSRIVLGSVVEGADLDRLNAAILGAYRASKLESTHDGIRWGWGFKDQNLDLILWSVALQATRMLTSESIKRVGECEDDRGCGYLFIDESKNHSRRWCTMQSCGNRAKARRHYQKQAKKQIKIKRTS